MAQYEWIAGKPVQTDESNFEWVAGSPLVVYAPPIEVVIELISGLKKEILLESKSIKTINLKSRVYGDS